MADKKILEEKLRISGLIKNKTQAIAVLCKYKDEQKEIIEMLKSQVLDLQKKHFKVIEKEATQIM